MKMLNSRNSLKSAGWPSVGWLWLVALLALPDCSFHPGSVSATPTTTAVFCDIENPDPAFARHCASDDERLMGMRQASAAVNLVAGLQAMGVSLDESSAALAACPGVNQPQAVFFTGNFPTGQSACVDTTTVGPGLAYADSNAFCVAVCKGLFPDPSGPDAATFCTAARAHASTNFPANPSPAFDGACLSEGTLRTDFTDPRQTPEPVVWQDPLGVTPSGNDLQRTAATSPPPANPPFDAGAASTQWIARGDAYVEFSAAEATLSHVLGLSELGSCPFPCTDTTPGLTDINFAISLNKDGHFYLLESGSLILIPDADGKGPDVNGSFGPYAAGDRFRVSVRQSADGSNTATVTYSRITGPCMPGMPCPETVFYTHAGLATYPLRVDTSFREVNAKVTDVRLARIQ